MKDQTKLKGTEACGVAYVARYDSCHKFWELQDQVLITVHVVHDVRDRHAGRGRR